MDSPGKDVQRQAGVDHPKVRGSTALTQIPRNNDNKADKKV
jgi:hypothetical protein